MADELTEALKELRTMFPGNPWLRIESGAIAAGNRADIFETQVVVNTENGYKVIRAKSHSNVLALSEAMAQVRSWKAAQEKGIKDAVQRKTGTS